MRLKAYLLAADPAWMDASVTSYYELVDEIVVSSDKDGLGWTGKPVESAECIERLKAIDMDKKMRFITGHYARRDYHPVVNDTYQRQVAFDEASKDADWVVHIDTDEVLATPAVFKSCLEEANDRGFAAMDFPGRFLYKQVGEDRYLEMCSRFWRTAAGYPGPVAAIPGTKLRLCRQCDVPLFRVDFRARSTSLAHPKTAPVHRVIGEHEGIYHYTWVRDEAAMIRKTETWGHAPDKKWDSELAHWLWSGRHPYLTTLSSLWQRGDLTKHLRIAQIPRVPTMPMRKQRELVTDEL
jgi:hypothetical protein